MRGQGSVPNWAQVTAPLAKESNQRYEQLDNVECMLENMKEPTRRIVPAMYTSSACCRSRSVRAFSGASRRSVSTTPCRALKGVTTVEVPLHAGQFVPPFYESEKTSAL
jgi:hypothetical protein